MINSTTLARLYLASVYNDVRVFSLPASRLFSILAPLFFVYFEGFELFAREATCKASFHDWRPPMGPNVALLHRTPNLIHHLAYYGFWRASQFTPRVEFSSPKADLTTPPFAADGTWAEVLRLAPTWSGARTAGEGGAFGCWFELSSGSGIALNVGRSLRVHNRTELARVFDLNLTALFAKPVRGSTHIWESYRASSLLSSSNASSGSGSGGSRGSGSGSSSVVGSVVGSGSGGGSSRVVSASGWPPTLYAGIDLWDEVALRRRYFQNAPWRLEARVDFCAGARRLGYDSIQILHELCSMERDRAACGVELISCHPTCLALRNRADRKTCVPGLPLRTGWDLTINCHCNSSLAMLNCLGNRLNFAAAAQKVVGHLKPTERRYWKLVPGRARSMHWIKACVCSWCEGNRSHVDSHTQA